ncbi:MAG TPA: family 10 glycosylhydrolase [Pyrinomonadaceae bacterium]|nr:family 10 glycosylhydrolase [Pyrinomonadaceae bacterium]
MLLTYAVAARSQTPAPTPTPTPTPPPVRAAPPAGEVRALWVVRTTLTSKEKIRAMVGAAKENGFNNLIVQVRGRGDAYYRPRWEPRAAALKEQSKDFDPLAFTIKEARGRGLKVHAWVNTNLLANLDELPAEPEHVYNAHPEWLAVPRAVAAELYAVSPTDPRYRARIVEWSKANRGELEGVYTAPAHPAVREHVYSIWMDLLERYDLDGLHFDYVRFASPDFDYSRASLERFRAWLEPRLSAAERRLLDTALKSDPLAAADAYRDQFADFQREQVTSLVERIYYGVKKRRPATVVSASVFANDENAHARRFQDWRRWLAMGVLDVVCPMAYTPDTETFRRQIEVAKASAAAAGRRVWAGIGAYRITAESAVEKINAARAVGADGVILFSYDSTLSRGERNPAGDYLERVRRAAFDPPQ